MVSTPQEMDREKFPQNHRVGKMEQQRCYGWDLRLLNELRRFYQKFIIFTVDKMVDSNLKAFCANNVNFFDNSQQMTFKFQLWFFSLKFNRFIMCWRCCWGTEYTPHGWWQFGYQLDNREANKQSQKLPKVTRKSKKNMTVCGLTRWTWRLQTQHSKLPIGRKYNTF